MRLRRTHASIIGAPSGALASHGLTRRIYICIYVYINLMMVIRIKINLR